MHSRAAASCPIPEPLRRWGAPVAALLASALLLVLAGPSAWSLALAPLLPLLAWRSRGGGYAPAAAQAAAALSVASGGGAAGEMAALVSALLALVSERSRVPRLLFLATPAVLLAAGALRGILPLVLSAAAAALFAEPRLRRALIAAGAASCLAFSGLPGAGGGDAPGIVARSVARGTGAAWPDTVTLDHSMPLLLFDLAPVAGMDVELLVSAGGVRRPGPVGRLDLPHGGASFDILPGDTALAFTASAGTARLVLSRGWSPFQHPVVRFYGARTRGGTP